MTALARQPHPRIVFASIEAARQATPFFIDEAGVGPWLSTADPALLTQGEVQMSARDALHIPSVEQTGAPIPAAIIEQIRQQAAAIGLKEICPATGYWTLSETGELQAEQVLIACSDSGVSAEALRQLAVTVARLTNQEAVAIEISGQVEQIRAKDPLAS